MGKSMVPVDFPLNQSIETEEETTAEELLNLTVGTWKLRQLRGGGFFEVMGVQWVYINVMDVMHMYAAPIPPL